MDKETIQQIATEVVAQLPFGARYSVVYGVVTVLIGGLGIWFGSFLKTKGQNFATKQDFNELQRQLKANTELVETIKSEVGQKDWAQREWTNLRRIKLEALLEKMHDCEVHLDRHRNSVYDGVSPDAERDPVSELDQIAELYFPELIADTYAFSVACREHLQLGYALAPELLRMTDLDARKKALEGYRDASKQRWPAVLEARQTLRKAARRLLVSIIGVED